jgi:type IV pilus assembly protein PilN
MRLPINLASEPFRKDRPMTAAYSVCAVILAGLVLLLGFLILNERANMKETRTEVARLSDLNDKLAKEQAEQDAVLRLPANAEVLQRSLLLNTLLERKSISWTRIFSDLEGVLPHNVRLIQVRLPQINSQNEVSLDMTVGAQDPGVEIEFLKRLQMSPLFGPLTVHSSLPPSQNEPLFRYRISVDYGQKL